jgi:hypothetical protein
MPKFLTFHHEPERSWAKLEEAYRHLAKETTAVWVRTYYQTTEGFRICEWDSPSDETLVVIFKRMGVTFEKIIPVEEILPSRWR